MIRLAHVITGLGGGGAEFMLARLVTALPTPEFEHHVISLTGEGLLADDIRAQQVAVHALSFDKGLAAIPALLALMRTLRHIEPDLIQTWLCHADLLGGLVGRYVLRRPVVWGIHQADSGADAPWTTRTVLGLCARLSGRVPTRIVLCSVGGLHARLAAGFPAARCEVIPNGVDITHFERDPAAGRALRRELGIADSASVVAFPARWHADKDFHNFVAAAAQILARYPDTRFLLFGAGSDVGNAELGALLRGAGVDHACHRVGFRRDLPALFSAADIGLLASRTEAFPNVIVEGMACGLPFAATDVGDVGAIIGAYGRVVPAASPQLLADAAVALLDTSAEARRELGDAARRRVEENFSMAACAVRYRALYQKLTVKSV